MIKTEVEFIIHNYTWVLKLVDKNNKNLIMDDGETHSGVTYFSNKVIYIRNDLCKDSFVYTLYHELTHAFIDSFGMLQVEWNDEIVADFMAIYIQDIQTTFNYIYKELTGSLEDWIDKLKTTYLKHI